MEISKLMFADCLLPKCQQTWIEIWQNTWWMHKQESSSLKGLSYQFFVYLDQFEMEIGNDWTDKLTNIYKFVLNNVSRIWYWHNIIPVKFKFLEIWG